MALKLDLHVHTHYSIDSWLSLKSLNSYVQKKGLDGIAVTDHDTIRGALKLKKLNPPFKLIIGEEISTASGDIIGYFLQEEIEAGLSVEETIRRIKDQGGLVAIPHPFDRLRSCRLEESKLNEIIDKIDMLEVYNSRTLFASDTQRAVVFAKEHSLSQIAGSDAHGGYELAQSYTSIDEFSGSDDFLEKIKTAEITFNGHSAFWLYPLSGLAKLYHYVKPL